MANQVAHSLSHIAKSIPNVVILMEDIPLEAFLYALHDVNQLVFEGKFHPFFNQKKKMLVAFFLLTILLD